MPAVIVPWICELLAPFVLVAVFAAALGWLSITILVRGPLWLNRTILIFNAFVLCVTAVGIGMRMCLTPEDIHRRYDASFSQILLLSIVAAPGSVCHVILAAMQGLGVRFIRDEYKGFPAILIALLALIGQTLIFSIVTIAQWVWIDQYDVAINGQGEEREIRREAREREFGG